MGTWFILRNNLQYGPYTTEQMLAMEGQGQLFAGDWIYNSATRQTLPFLTARQLWHPAVYSTPQGYYPSPDPAMGLPQKKPKKRLPKWARIVVAGSVSILILLLVGFGVWKAGEMTGYWQERELVKASAEWKTQAGFAKDEQEIMACLKDFADKLEENDIPGALNHVYIEDQPDIQALLTQEAAKIPALVTALRNAEISFLSTDTGNYEALRMATVTVGKTQAKSGASGGFTVVLVKTEAGWVVSSL